MYDLFYPVAEQIAQLKSSVSELETNAFAITASGIYLDRKAAEQGITRHSATYAIGIARIYGNRGEIIRAGSKLAADNILFSVDESVTISEEGYADVYVTCVTAGEIGNVKVGEINRFPVTLPGLTGVSNITPTTGGYDEENDYDLLERYLEKVSRPNVSGNKYHYIEWAKEIVGVGNVQVISLWNGPGTVKLIITDTDNQPADEDLVAEVKEHIDNNRPIGADVTVESAASLTINISVKVESGIKDTIKPEIEATISDYLSEVALNKAYVSYAKIGGIILSISGVEDYSELVINEGTANIPLDDGVIPVLGIVNIS
ncbi:MAG: baseplate J/gp47 family protein [bacterium]|nr:baseplate J/gp47 family protein [bacterium]